MTFRPLSFLLAPLTATLLILSGCVNTSTLVTRHLAEPGEPAVTHLLLVGRSPDIKTRRQWESACASRLQHAGLNIALSHHLWSEDVLPPHDSLMQQAQQSGFDGVLIGEITALLLAPMQLPPENVVSQERRSSSDASPQAEGFQITLGGKERQTFELQDMDIEFQLLSAQGKMLWNGLLRTHEANQIEAIARSQCKRVREALIEASLLP